MSPRSETNEIYRLTFRAASNHRLEQSPGSVFAATWRESMIGIKQLRFFSAQPRVARPHR
jgi:hypothetical protein